MGIGSTVTIRTYDRSWMGAQIVGVGKDTFTGTQDIFLVQHPHFAYPVHFYQVPDVTKGVRLNEGNAAYWIEEEG